MAPSDEAIRVLTEQVAALTARVYRLEQINRIETEVASADAQQATEVSSPPKASEPETTAPGFGFSVSRAAILHSREGTGRRHGPSESESNLEKRIGQYWLNRIGILAILGFRIS